MALPAAPLPSGALDLLDSAHRDLAEAEHAAAHTDRYAAAHRSALRAAAAVLAVRARPDGKRRVRTAWELLARVAPEMQEWAAFFAAGAAKRAAAEAGLSSAVTEREADDLVRDVRTFLGVAETVISRPAPVPTAPVRLRSVDQGARRRGPGRSGTAS